MVRGLPEVCPVVAEETAVMLMSCSVAVETGPKVECESDRVMSERRWWILPQYQMFAGRVSGDAYFAFGCGKGPWTNKGRT